MMETTEHGSRDDRALGRRWWSDERLLLREGLMRTRLVVEAHKVRHEGAELRPAEDEDMIEQLASESADETLGEGVHVGRSGRGPHDARADRLERAGKAPPELPIAVADEQLRDVPVHRGVPRLLRAPFVAGRVGRGGVDDHAPAQVEEEEDEDLAEEDVVGLREVGDPRDVVLEKVDQRCPSLGRRGRRMYFWTVRFATRMPSFSNSPRMRSAPQRGFATDISRMSAAFAVRGRPDGCERRRQRARNPARCQRRIVAGWTSKTAARHVGTTRDARAIVARRHGAHRTRPAILRSATMSCWRSIAFSATRCARGRTTSASNRAAKRTRSSILFWYRGHGAATPTE
jgi:hypothetical protein